MLYIPIPDQLKHLGEEYNHCGIITVDSFGWEITKKSENGDSTSINLCCSEQKKILSRSYDNVLFYGRLQDISTLYNVENFSSNIDIGLVFSIQLIIISNLKTLSKIRLSL